MLVKTLKRVDYLIHSLNVTNSVGGFSILDPLFAFPYETWTTPYADIVKYSLSRAFSSSTFTKSYGLN